MAREIEHRTGKALCDTFDLVCGTSIGGASIGGGCIKGSCPEGTYEASGEATHFQGFLAPLMGTSATLFRRQLVQDLVPPLQRSFPELGNSESFK